MNTIRVIIKFRGDADRRKRLGSSITLRKLVNDLRRGNNVDLQSMDEVSCEFTISVSADKPMTKEELQNLVGQYVSPEEYDIIISEVDDEAEDSGDSFITKGGTAASTETNTSETAGENNEGEESDGFITKGGTAAAGAEATTEGESNAFSDLGKIAKDQESYTLEGVMKKIHDLIGAEEFKKKAEELVRLAPRLKSIKGYFSKNRFLFSIDNGNGLSTAAGLFAQLLDQLGLNTSGRIRELSEIPSISDPDEFPKLRNWLKENADFNGVVVIDLSKCYNDLLKEGYREIMSTLNAIQNDSTIMVFRIPYLDVQARRMVEEALTDQFVLHTIPFIPASMEELYTYAKRSAEALGYTFAEDMETAFQERLVKEKCDGRFYGFKTVEKIVHAIVYEKIKNDTDAESTVISAANLTPISNEMDYLGEKSGMQQLDELEGMDSVVERIRELVGLIEYGYNHPEDKSCFHMRFIGNPGTGKTTVARILGKILKEKGILRTGVFFEYAGNDFVAQYVGHTAPKTAQMCRDAYGGILFIDEAYELDPGKNGATNSGNNFNREALNTLLTEMENHRQDMIVIMAGYEDDIDELMKHNPGLDQRMPHTIKFESFSKEVLADIFLSMASKRFNYDEEFVATVRNYFETLPRNIYYNPNFSNARYVRNLYERTMGKAILRAQLEKVKVATLIPVDFEKAVEEMEASATASSRYGKDESGATMFSEERATIKFRDVCGQDEAKEMLVEIVDCLKNPEKYAKIGAKVPKGALLYGPPGTGKTMLAKAVAGEAGVPVLTIAGSDLISSYVGKGAEQVKKLFEKARKLSPCIVFIDEIDSIGTSRNAGGDSAALMQLLTEMDGFQDDKTVIILAATNRPEMLDPALRRPGRFDREIPVELPEQSGRIAILAHYLEVVAHEDDIDLVEVAKMTSGFSGAELKNIVNEAALMALRAGRDKITTEDLKESAEVMIAGYVAKNRAVSDKEKWIVCYHEIGHALVSALQGNTSPVKKITVVPRTSGALGYVMHYDDAPRYLETKTEMENRIAVLLAGRAAEEVHFNEITGGASNDIEKATRIARAMVATYGMTEEFDMAGFDISSHNYLGGGKKQTCSDATAKEIDMKVIEIIREQHKRAIELLRAHEDLLDLFARFVFEKETITGEEFMAMFNEKMHAENA